MRAFAAALLCCLAVPLRAESGVSTSPKTTELAFPDGKVIIVDVVDTPLARERGLMFRKSLPKDYGMLFVFERQGGMQFWMKNTWTSLDIVFIDKEKRITAVHHRVRPSTAATRDEDVARAGGLAQYVLELPAGDAKRHKLKAGRELKFEVAVPRDDVSDRVIFGDRQPSKR